METYHSVIHSDTGKTITAFILENDATWVGREKEIFYATPLYCEKDQKIKMIFVKTYRKKNNTVVSAYFRKKKGEQNLRTNISGESDEHKIAKQNIYEGIYSGKIKINGESLNKEKVKNIYIEYRTTGSTYVIPDITVELKEEDSVYGNGFNIEIQLSSQTENKTKERSYDRLINGFSVVWLWGNNFNKNMEFIGDDIKINPYKLSLKELEGINEKEFLNKVNRYGEIVDEKILKFKNDADIIFNININKLKKESEEVKNTYILIDNKVKNIKDEIDKHIRDVKYNEEGIRTMISEFNNDHCEDDMDRDAFLIDAKNKIIEFHAKLEKELEENIKESKEELKNIADSVGSINTESIKNSIEEESKKRINSFIYNNKDEINKTLNKYSEDIIQEKISEEFNNKINKQIDEWFSRIPLKNISKELVDRCLPKKICPICGKNMGIGTTINNDSNWYCEKFPYCSGMIKGFDK